MGLFIFPSERNLLVWAAWEQSVKSSVLLGLKVGPSGLF